MAKTSAQPEPVYHGGSTYLHQLRWLLGGLLVLLTLWPLMAVNIAPQVLILLIGLVIGTALIFPRIVGRIPPGIFRITTPLLALFVFVDVFLNISDILAPLIRLVLLLLFYLSLRYRTRREEMQLILLCLFGLVIAGVLSLSLAFGLQLLLFTPVALTQLLVLNLLQPSAARVLTMADWQDFHWRSFLRRLRRDLDTRMLLFSGGLYTIILGLSALVFVTLPRFDFQNNLQIFNRTVPGLSGFSDSIEIGQVNDIVEDYSIALSVEPPSREAVPADPYWRMVVLDRYRDGRFSTSDSARDLRNERRLQEWRPGGYSSQSLAEEDTWKFYLEGGVSAYLPLLGSFETLRLQKNSRLFTNEALQVYALPVPQDKVFAYQMTAMETAERWPAMAQEQQRLANAQPLFARDGEEPAYPYTTLELPPLETDRAALQTLANQIQASAPAGGNLAYAQAAAVYLRENYRYDFSVDARFAEGEGDPIVHWLTNAQTGWCEHFAGSLVLLCRTAGVPARAVTGFRGASWNDYENYLIVRNRNAHAWVEVYDQGSWVRVDPTPGLAFDVPGFENALATVDLETGWGAWLDSLRMVWYRSVINFDEEQQTELATSVKERLKEAGQNLLATAREWLAAAKAWLREGWDRERLMQLLGLLAGLLAAVYLLRRLGTALPLLLVKKAQRGKMRMAPVRRKAGRWLRRLEATPQATETRANLLVLRYGPQEEWPQPQEVFAQARIILRQKI